MSWRASAAGTAGPAACQPPLSAKMPATPGRAQPAASIGVPDTPKAAAVSPVTPQPRPAGVAARARAVDRRVHAVPVPSLAPPPLVSAMRRPPGPAASASGALARPGLTGPDGDQVAPSSLVAASGENVRSWLGRNPVTSDPPPDPATTRPSATPGGVASRQPAVPAGRTNSSQKLSCRAAGPPISTTAHPAPVAPANEEASGGGAAGAATCAELLAGVLPQPAIKAPAASRHETAVIRPAAGCALRPVVLLGLLVLAGRVDLLAACGAPRRLRVDVPSGAS